ncbi:hypothetical protein ACSLBF_14510 [Pseudoalteromonas sp. T1lg65]|uniref:hypothetical protein n=1 Tax=Pseudoalteromonas sp. T1lg65 TaxID=2077101 RepID=UPI003F7A3627
MRKTIALMLGFGMSMSIGFANANTNYKDEGYFSILKEVITASGIRCYKCNSDNECVIIRCPAVPTVPKKGD